MPRPSHSSDAALDLKGATTLYQRLLGSAWLKLPNCIQRLHATLAPIQMQGNFSVSHGQHLVSRILARVLRLPPESAATHILLTVARKGDAEIWTRRFGECVIVTRQSAEGDDVLCERFGLLDFRFKLYVENGQLVYRQTAASLRVGPCSFRLPRSLSPVISAVEKPCSTPDSVEVSVEVRLPWSGLLLAYHGIMDCGRSASE
jgi:hypothetical protein